MIESDVRISFSALTPYQKRQQETWGDLHDLLMYSLRCSGFFDSTFYGLLGENAYQFSSRTDDVVVQGEVSCVSSGEVSQFFKGSTWQSEHVYDFFFAAFCREKRSPQSLLNKARYLNFCSRKRSEGNISASLRTY